MSAFTSSLSITPSSRNYAIAGVFGVTALATATIIVPVPYIPVVMHIAQQYHDLYHLVLVALAAGLDQW
jgi:hypothetical protein